MATRLPAWAGGTVDPPVQRERRRSGHRLARLAGHGVVLLLAVACFVAYEHLKLEGRWGAALACLVLAAVLAFLPIRHLLRALLGLEGRALHVVHGVGSLALVALPLTGAVSGTPVVTRAWMAPFAVMGAAQALMHQNHPRDAAQAAALRRFTADLPAVARMASSANLASPRNASRAVALLADVIARAQALGESKLQADSGFQGALRQTSARVELNLGLDAVTLALRKLAASPAAAGAVPELRLRLAAARRAVAGAATR